MNPNPDQNQASNQNPPLEAKREVKNFLNKKTDPGAKKQQDMPPFIARVIKWVSDKKRVPYLIAILIWLILSTILINVVIAIIYWKVYAWIIGSLLSIGIIGLLIKLLMVIKTKVKALILSLRAQIKSKKQQIINLIQRINHKFKSMINYLVVQREKFYRLFTNKH